MKKNFAIIFLVIQLFVFAFVIYVSVITIDYVKDNDKKQCSDGPIDLVRGDIIKKHAISTIVLLSLGCVLVLLTLIDIIQSKRALKEYNSIKNYII